MFLRIFEAFLRKCDEFFEKIWNLNKIVVILQSN